MGDDSSSNLGEQCMANIPTMVQVLITKIVPPNKNDLKKHLRHRDRLRQQVENMIRLLGHCLEPRVRHPLGENGGTIPSPKT